MESSRTTTMDLRDSFRNQTQVSIEIANRLLSRKAQKSNVVFSPVSVHVLLSLITAGSKGQTLDQLLSFLKSNTTNELNDLSSQLVSLVLADGSPSGGPHLTFANGVWVEKTMPLKTSFKQIVDTVYKAASNQVDFQTKAVEVTKEVNLWAEKQTSGLIKQVLPVDAVNDATRFIFANALYFKGDWTEKFDVSKTKDYDFHLLDGSKVQVPFMTSKKKKRLVCAYADFKVLGLPYLQGEDKRHFTMYIFLPNAKDGLPSLVEKLGSQSDFLDHHIPQHKAEVGQLLIPKFKISFGFEASEMLKELGLVLPFSGGEGLTKMVESPSTGKNLYVSSIHHKSVMEVNEEGTEAAAASAAVMMKCARVIGTDFVADHPFLFVIKEDMTGVMLFIGQVVNPLLV